MAHEVFISYSSKDKAYADRICHNLESKSIHCWIAPRDIVPGQTYASGIIQGISESKCMVLVFSASSNGSPQVAREVERAVSRGISVLPVRIDGTLPSDEMEYYISSAHWLDALTEPFDSHLWKLGQSVRGVLAGGRPQPMPMPSIQPTPLLVERQRRYGHPTRFVLLWAVCTLIGGIVTALSGCSAEQISSAVAFLLPISIALVVSGFFNRNGRLKLIGVAHFFTGMAVIGEGARSLEPRPLLAAFCAVGLALTAWPSFQLFFDRGAPSAETEFAESNA